MRGRQRAANDSGDGKAHASDEANDWDRFSSHGIYLSGRCLEQGDYRGNQQQETKPDHGRPTDFDHRITPIAKERVDIPAHQCYE